MDLRGLFLNRGNTSSKHGRSAEYPDVSKPHFWNSGRGPSTTGACVAGSCCRGPETTPAPAPLLSPLWCFCRHTDVPLLQQERPFTRCERSRGARLSAVGGPVPGKCGHSCYMSVHDIIPSIFPESPADNELSLWPGSEEKERSFFHSGDMNLL